MSELSQSELDKLLESINHLQYLKNIADDLESIRNALWEICEQMQPTPTKY